jgi:hypothetical protein
LSPRDRVEYFYNNDLSTALEVHAAEVHNMTLRGDNDILGVYDRDSLYPEDNYINSEEEEGSDVVVDDDDVAGHSLTRETCGDCG